DDAKNTYTLTGNLHSVWSPSWATDLSGGRELYYFARAIDADVISNFIDTRLLWQPEGDWKASARVRLEDLSDDNQRATGILQGAHEMFLPKLWVVARATLDTTEHISPNYYSPQTLQEYQLGVDYTVQLARNASLNVAYMPGYGKEKTTDG